MQVNESSIGRENINDFILEYSENARVKESLFVVFRPRISINVQLKIIAKYAARNTLQFNCNL